MPELGGMRTNLGLFWLPAAMAPPFQRSLTTPRNTNTSSPGLYGVKVYELVRVSLSLANVENTSFGSPTVWRPCLTLSEVARHQRPLFRLCGGAMPPKPAAAAPPKNPPKPPPFTNYQTFILAKEPFSVGDKVRGNSTSQLAHNRRWATLACVHNLLMARGVPLRLCAVDVHLCARVLFG